MFCVGIELVCSLKLEVCMLRLSVCVLLMLLGMWLKLMMW